ncbi:hypothetical protein DICVIV_00513 [Dictyocaulus viviparus]|uniref:Ataxin-10 n=1 Tax=Dictyocaulus viviparus TaxID=29172 RepID=A0A0D8YAK8_DICVI|nr:hypothetical protein DICVIV_00513 [Dictyocaulus viviparus]
MVDVRRSRIALRTLVNGVNRSKKFAGSVNTNCLSMLRALLRLPDLHTETFALLVGINRPLRITCALSDAYPALIGEIILLWESKNISDSDRSWISAFVSINLEEDFGFLSSCFADLSCEEFAALLHITEVLMDSCHEESLTKTHPNNISFCVNLLKVIIYHFGQGEMNDRRLVYVEQVAHTVEIIASAALRETEYSSHLLDQPEAVETVVDILEAVLEAQWLTESEDSLVMQSQLYSDGLQGVRSPHVAENSGLAALSAAISEAPVELRANLKCGAVRAIGNLCSERLSLRRAAGARGAVLAVLRCARLTDKDRPFIVELKAVLLVCREIMIIYAFKVQWSISALRHLCLDCPENQSIILKMDQKPIGIIDREKLLKELGVNVGMDASPIMSSFTFVLMKFKLINRAEMDFSELERAVYGGNVEEDEELLAELLALQQEEEAKQRSV